MKVVFMILVLMVFATPVMADHEEGAETDMEDVWPGVPAVTD